MVSLMLILLTGQIGAMGALLAFIVRIQQYQLKPAVVKVQEKE